MLGMYELFIAGVVLEYSARSSERRCYVGFPCCLDRYVRLGVELMLSAQDSGSS